MSRDIEYIQRRALQERFAAEAASDEKSRRIHLELQARYEDILGAYGVARSKAA